MESKAGRVVFDRDEVGSDSMLSHRPTVIQAIPDSVINVFLRGKKKMNNSSLTNDRLVRRVKRHATLSPCNSSGSHDELVLLMSRRGLSSSPLLQTAQSKKYTCQTEGM